MARSQLARELGRALHRHRRGHGFNSHTGLSFYQYLLSLLLIISSVHYFEVHSRIHFPHCFLNVPKGADKDNLLNNRDFLYVVIISFILTTLMCDSGAILLGEIRN